MPPSSEVVNEPGSLLAALFFPTLIVGLLVAAIVDLKWRRSPNFFTLPFLAAGLLMATLQRGHEGLVMALAGVVVGFGLLFLPFAIRIMGGGDLKFVAALGAWLGPLGIVFGVLWGFALGGVLCLAILLKQKSLRREVAVNLWNALLCLQVPEIKNRSPKLAIPMVAAFAAGGAIAASLGWGL